MRELELQGWTQAAINSGTTSFTQDERGWLTLEHWCAVPS